MTSFVFTSLLILPVVAAAVEEGTKLEYQGQFVAVKGDPTESKKTFSLQALAKNVMANKTSVVWTLEEKGHGGWSWPDRFGLAELDGRWHPTGPRGPSLLYDRGDGKSVVPVILPLLPMPDGPLEKGTSWEWNKLQHAVVESAKMRERNCWKVEVRNAYGVKRTVWVDKAEPVVVALRERVFIGQGLEHDLILELASQSKLPPDELAKLETGLESLQKLYQKLGREPQNQDPNWNDEQLAVLKADTATVAAVGSVEFLGSLAKAIEQDVKNQKGRAGAVAAFRERAIGGPVGKFKLDAVGGAGITDADLKDKVTILHFWEYRDSPLEEPYGQVGYLDFFFRKQDKKSVSVYGVAVDDKATDATGRRKAGQAANRMKSFMNLSYPLLIDDGTVLKLFGDPRVAGAKLPLFVVIDKNGKILEYHAGHYEVQRDRGLEELNKIVTKAAGSRE